MNTEEGLPRGKSRGFTLVEIIVVLAIILLLVGLGLAAYRTFGRNVNLGTVSQQIVIVLDDARSRTVASLSDSQYGVHFENDTYTLFQGSTYNAQGNNNEAHPLPTGVEFGSITLSGGGNDVVFDRITGTTSQSGTIVLRLTDTPATTQTITISPQGQADASGSVAPTDTRVTDTRHVHFTLGWTIQGTSTLTLTFSNPSHTENISMSDYFNADQTDFDWEGDVDVGGDSEHLRIQSHSIDATNTTLSVERDRRDNDVAVAVSIDGNEIVSYAADGTATVGSDGGTMEVQ
ncbi:MAG: prepilin-type N-terminal cleavage/methylation domain-containing protein [Patescibacteria group bacterium]